MCYSQHSHNKISTDEKCPESLVRVAKNLPRKNLKIESLNVRTLAHAGCLQTLKRELAKYDLDILGIQETRLDEQEIGLGTHKLFLTNSLRSSNCSKQVGVVVLVKKTLFGCKTQNVTVNERLCYIKFAEQQRTNLIAIVCYAPSKEADIQTKECFRNTLTSSTNGFRKRSANVLSETSIQTREVIKRTNIYALALLILAKRTITQTNF